MVKDMGLTLVVVNFIFLPLSCIAMALRIYIRSTRRTIGADDYLLLAGLVLFAATVTMSTLAAQNGVGEHHPTWGSAEMRDGIMYFTLWQLFYVSSTVPVKASICISLLRITMKPLFRVILLALIVLSCISTLIACIVVWATCRPMAFTWDKTIDGGKCSSLEMTIALSYVVSGVNIVTDWTCAIMPALILWDVQMRRKLKISVCVILGMGAIASTATLVRLKAIPSYRNTTDHLYGICEIAIWSVVEIGFGIIAGSIATLKPLFNKIFGSTTDPNSYANDRTSRPFPGSYRLRDVSKCGLDTTVTARGDNDRSDISEEDTASQRRILRGVTADRSSPEERDIMAGIMVTHHVSVKEGFNSDFGSHTRC